MPKLVNLDVEYVSLVDRAAVRNPSNPTEPQRFLLWKRESGEPTKKGDSVPENTDDLRAALTKTEEERDALQKELDDLKKAAAEKPEAEVVSEPEQIDKAELPEPVRLALEKAEAEAVETRKRLEKAEEIAKAERDMRVTREFVAKAEEMPALPIKADEFGPVLKRAAEALESDDFDAIENVLKTANEQLAKGELFKEMGRSGDVSGETDAVENVQRKAEELRKADPSLTPFQAMERAMREDPEAQARYLAANR